MILTLILLHCLIAWHYHKERRHKLDHFSSDPIGWDHFESTMNNRGTWPRNGGMECELSKELQHRRAYIQPNSFRETWKNLCKMKRIWMKSLNSYFTICLMMIPSVGAISLSLLFSSCVPFIDLTQSEFSPVSLRLRVYSITVKSIDSLIRKPKTVRYVRLAH